MNENGLLSFQTELPSYYNVELPMDYPVIAPFYTDVDIRRSGQVEKFWTSTERLLCPSLVYNSKVGEILSLIDEHVFAK